MKNTIIGICDDQILIVKQLEKMVTACLQKEKKSAKICLFESGEEALACSEKMDILFLDMGMPGIDGIDVGHLIRKENPDCKIIIATSYVERFKEAFKISAFRFVTKPFSMTEIREALKDAMREVPGTDMLELYRNRLPYLIQQRQIVYIRAYNGYIEAVCGNKRFRKDVSLTAIECEMDRRLFYRVNKTYLINMWHVTGYYKGIVSVGNEKIRVSRQKRKDFEKILEEFDLDYR